MRVYWKIFFGYGQDCEEILHHLQSRWVKNFSAKALGGSPSRMAVFCLIHERPNLRPYSQRLMIEKAPHAIKTSIRPATSHHPVDTSTCFQPPHYVERTARHGEKPRPVVREIGVRPEQGAFFLLDRTDPALGVGIGLHRQLYRIGTIRYKCSRSPMRSIRFRVSSLYSFKCASIGVKSVSTASMPTTGSGRYR